MWVGDCKYVRANPGVPLHQTRVRFRPKAISGIPLLEQEFALREATVGRDWKYEFICTPTGNRQKETTNILF